MLAPLVIFFILIVVGIWLGELDKMQVTVFLAVWGFALVVCMSLNLSPFIFVTFQAILDCVLILMIFGEGLQIR